MGYGGGGARLERASSDCLPLDAPPWSLGSTDPGKVPDRRAAGSDVRSVPGYRLQLDETPTTGLARL